MTGIVEGASEAVMSWQPHVDDRRRDAAEPPRPGHHQARQRHRGRARRHRSPSSITYRNMGNTPIRSVSIVDSLLPRLEYVKGSAKGPKGTDFSTGREPRRLDRAEVGPPRRDRPGRLRRGLVPGRGQVKRTI